MKKLLLLLFLFFLIVSTVIEFFGNNKDDKNYEQSDISDEGIEWLGHEWNRDKKIIRKIKLKL